MKLTVLLSVFPLLTFAAPAPKEIQPLSRRDYVVSPYTAPLKRVKQPSGPRTRRDHLPTAPLIDHSQMKFAVEASIGGQIFDMEVDTGSSNTWVVDSEFVCLEKAYPIKQSSCNFGSGFHPGPDNFDRIPDARLSTRYVGGHREVIGDPGYTDVVLAGVTVHRAIVSDINLVVSLHSYNFDDGSDSKSRKVFGPLVPLSPCPGYWDLDSLPSPRCPSMTPASTANTGTPQYCRRSFSTTLTLLCLCQRSHSHSP